MVVALDSHCQDQWVTNSIVLFMAFFSLKSSPTVAWYYFSPWKRDLKVDLPNKNVELKNKFMFFCVALGVELPTLWRIGKIPNAVGSSGSRLGFNTLGSKAPHDGDLSEELIPRGEGSGLIVVS